MYVCIYVYMLWWYQVFIFGNLLPASFFPVATSITRDESRMFPSLFKALARKYAAVLGGIICVSKPAFWVVLPIGSNCRGSSPPSYYTRR